MTETFSHTYTMGKTTYYLGRRMAVPDQVDFHMTQSCAASESVQAYSGRKSYMKELEKRVSVSGVCILLLFQIIINTLICFFRWLFSIICFSIILTQLWYDYVHYIIN